MTSNKYLKTNDNNSIGGVTATVDSFASRIKRKIKEQEERESESQKISEVRHGLMLQAIALCRRALQEASKIYLGNRFFLDIEVNDLEGWPRIELTLIDSRNPENQDCSLLVSANDRKELGTIWFALRSGEHLGQVQLCNDGESTRLPLVLKKSIRMFLDVVAVAVLDKQQELEPEETEVTSLEEKEIDEVDLGLQQKELFTDDIVVINRNVIVSDDDSDSDLRVVLSVD